MTATRVISLAHPSVQFAHQSRGRHFIARLTRHLQTPFGPGIDGLPADVAGAWREAGTAFSLGAFTAAEMMCRKLSMHVAVDKEGCKAGRKLCRACRQVRESGRHRLWPSTCLIDHVKNRGNTANHDLPASDEAASRLTLKVTQHLLQGVYERRSLPRRSRTRVAQAGALDARDALGASFAPSTNGRATHGNRSLRGYVGGYCAGDAGI